MHYAEARSKQKRHHRTRGRKKIRILTNDGDDRHVIEHHFEDGGVDRYEFLHPDENAAALDHLAQHMQISPAEAGAEEAGAEEEEGGRSLRAGPQAYLEG